MKLATLRLQDRTVAVRVDEGSLVELGHPDAGALLAAEGLAAAATADGPRHDADQWSNGMSFFAIATKLASRASDARRS